MRRLLFDDSTEDDWVQEGEIVEIMKHGSPVISIAVNSDDTFYCSRCVFFDVKPKNGVHCKAPYSKDKSQDNRKVKVCCKHYVYFVPIDKTLENL